MYRTRTKLAVQLCQDILSMFCIIRGRGARYKCVGLAYSYFWQGMLESTQRIQNDKSEDIPASGRGVHRNWWRGCFHFPFLPFPSFPPLPFLLSLLPSPTHERVSETGVFPSLDCVSGTLCLSHYVTEISPLYSLRDFWRHFGLCRAAADSDLFFAMYKYTYLLTYLRFLPFPPFLSPSK